MWFLKSQKDAIIYYIRPDVPKHVVSRSTGNLIIPNDPSISRNHALLMPEPPDTLKLVDTGSRYGTFLNYAIESDREEIPKNVPVRLSQGDRIRFGKCDSLWQLDRVEFRCISSTISATDGLERSLRKLGGTLEDGFEVGKTKFLAMKTITTTPKLLMSLIAQIPVVTPEYFEECLRAVEGGRALPDPEGFIPEFTEAYVRREGISFRKVPAREKLFEGMTFIFIKPKHMTQYEGIVKMAGGKCVCAQKHKIAKSYFTQDKVVVIQVTTDTLSQGTSQAMDGLTQIVNKVGRRLIPEAEIGLAILHCSLEKYCNPLYKFTSVLDLDTVPFVEAGGDTLARNSEDLPGHSKKTSSSVVESISIPETEPHDNKPGTLQSTNFSEAELKISEVESEFAKANENDTAGRSKRKRSEQIEPSKAAKKIRSKPVEEEIPETPEEPVSPPPPPSQVPPSQPSNLSGFLSVNHEEALNESKTAAPKPKRPLQLMLDDGEDDLFNFGEAVPKRAKRQQTLAESFTSSQRTQRAQEPTTAGDDLFAFGGETSRRAKRHAEAAPKADPKPQTATDASSYKQFIKPIKISADGWLSSTFCELKLKTQNEEVSVKRIKEEPGDEDGEDAKTRVWIDGMQSMFQVRVKCMNLTSHHRSRNESSERSFFATGQGATTGGGGKNFKAFVKKHNYKPQQTIVKTMPVCVLDNTQDDHF
uniref:Putative nibrin n=1 Tax=Culex tarsalis TaxID=7177 RepID=A0A1Q3EXG8_CULTA